MNQKFGIDISVLYRCDGLPNAKSVGIETVTIFIMVAFILWYRHSMNRQADYTCSAFAKLDRTAVTFKFIL